MGRMSIKSDKNIYHQAREALKLTRAAASELMGFVSESRIEKIEYEKTVPQPEDVLAMSRAYKNPGLCNHYCSKECPIGQEYIPEVKMKNLSQIVLELLSSLNALSKEKEHLIDICVDGKISDNELKDFARIRNELASISITIDALQLWINNTIASGKLDKEKLDSFTSTL